MPAGPYPLGSAPEVVLDENVYFTDIGATLPSTAARQELMQQAADKRDLRKARLLYDAMVSSGTSSSVGALATDGPATALSVMKDITDVFDRMCRVERLLISRDGTERAKAVCGELMTPILEEATPDSSDDESEEDFRTVVD